MTSHRDPSDPKLDEGLDPGLERAFDAIGELMEWCDRNEVVVHGAVGNPTTQHLPLDVPEGWSVLHVGVLDSTEPMTVQLDRALDQRHPDC